MENYVGRFHRKSNATVLIIDMLDYNIRRVYVFIYEHRLCCGVVSQTVRVCLMAWSSVRLQSRISAKTQLHQLPSSFAGFLRDNCSYLVILICPWALLSSWSRRWKMLNHLDQNTTFSFEAEPERVLDHVMAIVLNTRAEQQLKSHIIWILNAQKLFSQGFFSVWIPSVTCMYMYMRERPTLLSAWLDGTEIEDVLRGLRISVTSVIEWSDGSGIQYF